MIIKKGVTRLVFLIDNKAIKIPNFTYSIQNFLKGWLGNINESITWKAFNSEGIEDQEIKTLLCPVIKQYLWGFINIMPRCKPIYPASDDIHFLPHPKIKDICGDNKYSNYGYLEGKIVCFDYE